MSKVNRELKNYAVAAIFDPEERFVLLIKKNRPMFMAGLLSFPGGECEPHEKNNVTAARELEEETGLIIDPNDLKFFMGIRNNTIGNIAMFKGHADIHHADARTDEKLQMQPVSLLTKDIAPTVRWAIHYALDPHTEKGIWLIDHRVLTKADLWKCPKEAVVNG